MENRKIKVTDLVLNEGQIQGLPTNPRYWTKGEMETLKKSLKETPELFEARGIIVYPYEGKYIVLGGNMRLSASKELKMKEVPCIIIPEDTPVDKLKEIVIKDNGSFGSWDFDLLANEWDDLPLTEWGVPAWDENTENNTERSVKEDDFDETIDKVETRTKGGDIWQLGDHRLMCGDSTSVVDVDRLMMGEKATSVVSDPPYNTGMTGSTSRKAWLSGMFNDSYTDAEWEKFMTDFCGMYDYVMCDNSIAYISLDWRRDYELIPHLKKHFRLSNIIIWDKMVHGLGSDYKYTYEVINVCKKGKPSLNTHQGEKEYQDVWHIQRKIGRDEEHATKKPIELFARCIRHSTEVGDIVVDLFGGSGTTLLACEQLERKCRMMELDPHYCDVIIARWEKVSGKKAMLISK